ncbi:hypothetical protein TNCV_2318361 [Trichonephila clavipes]|nr:hypothetical protein TNCV_2318361 [Trichonephila clavipes]
MGMHSQSLTKPFFVQQKAKIDAKGYQNLVKKHMIKESNRLYPQRNFVFHQDFDQSHTSKYTLKWLKDKNINFLPPEKWLPSSPECAS